MGSKDLEIRVGCYLHRVSLFQGFSCCDASLRNEGCFFFGSGLPKLASGQGGAEEETKGAALASQQGFYLFLLTLPLPFDQHSLLYNIYHRNVISRFAQGKAPVVN